MIDQSVSHFTRRRFLATAELAATATVLVRHRSAAEEEGTVPRMRHEAATAKLTVQRVRGNLHVKWGNYLVSPESFIRAPRFAGSGCQRVVSVQHSGVGSALSS